MKVTWDKEVDAAYIYVRETIMHGEVTRTVQATSNINLDFDRYGLLLGIEILNAHSIVPHLEQLAIGSGGP